MSLYNLRNPAVKRLMKEAEELLHPTDEYHAQPIEDNLFEWHFTLRGPPNTDYEGGIYHGRITLPADYPMKPPSIILLTPNGRFETNKKICLSISGHHPESWQPSWSIRTALLAIIGFMPTHGNGALGSLDYTTEERQQLAAKSQTFQCSECGYIKDIFLKKDCHEQNLVQKSEPELERNQGQSTDVVSSDISVSSSSEGVLTQVNNDTSLIHRHKTSQTPTVNAETEVDTCKIRQSESSHSLLFPVFVFIIVTVIIFLCLRRIFSL